MLCKAIEICVSVISNFKKLSSLSTHSLKYDYQFIIDANLCSYFSSLVVLRTKGREYPGIWIARIWVTRYLSLVRIDFKMMQVYWSRTIKKKKKTCQKPSLTYVLVNHLIYSIPSSISKNIKLINITANTEHNILFNRWHRVIKDLGWLYKK